MTTLDWGLLCALSLLWGSSFFLTEVALEGFPPLTIAAGRIVIGAAVIVALLYASGRALPADPVLWRRFLTIGLSNSAVPWFLIAWGQQGVEAGVASILIASTPIFTALLAHLVTDDEKLSPGRAVGVALGFAGVTILIGGDALVAAAGGVISHFVVLSAAVMYACSGLYGRRFGALDPMVPAAGMLLCSSAVMLPAALLLDGPPPLAAPVSAWAAVLANGVLGTALAFRIYFTVLRRAGATNLMLVNFMIPVTAVLLGMAFLAERPGPQAWIGMATIFVGLALMDQRVRARLGRASKKRVAAPPPAD